MPRNFSAKRHLMAGRASTRMEPSTGSGFPFARTLISTALISAMAISHPTLAATTSHATHQQQSYQIPAGPLGKTLSGFAAEAGIPLSFNPELTQGLESSVVSGQYSPTQAIEQMLRQTRLMLIRKKDGSYTLVKQSADTTQKPSDLTGITVYGRLPDDSVTRIPQSVSVHNQETFDITLADNIADIIRLEPNAAPAGSSLDMFADNFLLRGFDAQQSVNGLGFARKDHPTDTVNIERIEILKGPASVLYGQMEPGGTINIVTKQPLDYFFAEAGIELGSDQRKRSTLDVTGPISDTVRARLNMSYLGSDSFVDSLENERLFIAPNVAIDLSDNTLLTIEGSYSRNEWNGLNGGTPLEGSVTHNPHGHYAASFNPSDKDSFTDRDSKEINIRLDHELSDTLRARASYTYTRNDANWQEQAPFGLDDDLRTLNRIVFAGTDTNKKEHNLILDLNGEFTTGRVEHQFIVGTDFSTNDVYRPTQIYGISPVDIFNPVYTPVDLNISPRLRDRTTYQEDDVAALFFQDRMALGDRWHLLAGMRYIDSEQSQKTVNNDSGSSSEDRIKQTDWSSQLGLIYDINPHTSVFVNRSESFVPQQGTTAGKKPLEAEEGTQYEAGIRFNAGKVLINAAAFVITKDNIAITDPLNEDFEIAAGKARSKGFELTAGGYINPNLYLAAAYGYNDTEILRSDDQALEGNRFANVPEHTASLQGRFHVQQIPGLSLGGTVTYMGERYGDDDNSFKLPDYTQIDLNASYEVNASLQADLLIGNISDETLYSPASFDGVVREPGRTYLARLKYTF